MRLPWISEPKYSSNRENVNRPSAGAQGMSNVAGIGRTRAELAAHGPQISILCGRICTVHGTVLMPCANQNAYNLHSERRLPLPVWPDKPLPRLNLVTWPVLERKIIMADCHPLL
jgi:hypothetical protein